MGLNKSELTQTVAEKFSLTKNQAQSIVETVLHTMSSRLREGDSVTLRHFGSFKAVTRRAREGRNPASGKPINIPERKVVTFKASKSLLDEV